VTLNDVIMRQASGRVGQALGRRAGVRAGRTGRARLAARPRSGRTPATWAPDGTPAGL